MKSAAVSVATLLGIIAIALGMSSDGIAQTPGVMSSWSYAYLLNNPGYPIEVAYLEGDKCRIEEFHVPVNRPFTSEVNFSATRNQSAASAMAALARDRYEMVGEGFAYCHYIQSNNVKVLHFKRR